jgi:flagellar protein FlaG
VKVLQIPSSLTSNFNNQLITIKTGKENQAEVMNNEKKPPEDMQQAKPPEDMQQAKPAEVTQEQAKSALETFNKIFKPAHLEFHLHKESGKYFVQIVDDKTKEVLKQIPSEEFLRMVAEAKEQHGLVIDKRV